ncbi:MAG: integrase [Planctomycetota bacterium]
MPQQLAFRGCPEPAKAAIQTSWLKKAQRLQRSLQRFPEASRHLRVVVSLRSDQKTYDVRAVLLLPTGTLVAAATATGHDPALDEVIGRLTQELRRLKERVRHEQLYHKRVRRQHEFASVSDYLARFVSQRDRVAFFDLLRPIMRSLHDHVARELTIAQLEGAVHLRELSVHDLIDEVIMLAWERFRERPVDAPLDRWLFELLHESLDRSAAQHSQASSLSQELRGNDPLNHPDDAWVVENDPCWRQPEQLTLEEALPSLEEPEPWQAACEHEERLWLLRELRTFDRNQRRAFMLHALEGWEPADIALQQQRSEAAVRADIDHVRHAMVARIKNQSPLVDVAYSDGGRGG